jgi:hypothetical protein
MAKIVYNACFGGFGLSDVAIKRYAEIKGITLYEKKLKGHFTSTMYYTTPDFQDDSWFYDRDIPRSDPVLAQVVEELGDKANGDCAELRIEEVSEGTLYRIDEYDGNERVMTMDSYDWEKA